MRLNDALLAYQKAHKTPLDMSLYKLVYGKNYQLPVQLEKNAYWAIKELNLDPNLARKHLNVLEEFRFLAYKNAKLYKERDKRRHDAMIKKRVFLSGQYVLFFNSRLKLFLGKLRLRWIGPYIVNQVLPNGALKLISKDGETFIVNGQRIKHFGYHRNYRWKTRIGMLSNNEHQR
ncbi:protein NYNRIN-like [Gossypium australe]|uniref:Protein NYNRIN-like n=1 Tax=Gossypium australe TaxID=47621 RepID=A0A5B6VAT1_9ROSI|nr:protein NYNRIN-like [Gossypium australe]